MNRDTFKPTRRKTFFVILALLILLLYMTIYKVKVYDPVPCDISYIKNSLTEYNRIKIIYGATVVNTDTDTWKGRFDDYSACKYSNCIMQYCHRQDLIEKADVVLFNFERINRFSVPTLPPEIRMKQIWLVFSHESPGYNHYHWPQIVDGKFNATMTYRQDSLVPAPYSKSMKLEKRLHNAINYAHGKTKCAYAYVSNCRSVGYDRLQLMKALSKHVPVDIYGDCTGILPCKRMDFECETKLHNQYRFFLSFENSLCKHYITEKFWSRLSSDGHFIPVALGGSSMAEYEQVAPPNSYLHVYNFSTIEQLGDYMKNLMVDDEAYNRYHMWRQEYKVGMSVEESPSCRLCAVANMKNVPVMSHMTDWWQGEDNCRSIEFKSNGEYHLHKFKSDSK